MLIRNRLFFYLWSMEWMVTMDNIKEVSREFWFSLKEKKVFAVRGQMGAGKTTFVHALCDEKQVSSMVSSPTFSIINEYTYPGGKVYHIDLYRLRDEDEAIRAGVEDCLFSGEICFVEWPERAAGIFPVDTIYITITPIDSQLRKIHTDPSS
jgi:tRNA threonylcarbamoyladenosine biosynthesis protein TsaE